VRPQNIIFTGEPDIQLYRRKLAFGSEILARALSENGEWRLRRTPRSDDRARSLAHVSKKREYFKCGPETIVDFAPKLLKPGVWRLTINSQKAAIGGHFSHLRANNLWLFPLATPSSGGVDHNATKFLTRLHELS
jgi:hypothetical protein